MNSAGIYTITSPSGGRYVGSAINIRLRWHSHKIALRQGKHKNKKLQNAWNKYGEESFRFAVILICRVSELLLYEQAAMDAIKPRYNICQIAGNSLGLRRTSEYKSQKSLSMKGIKQSPEMIARRSAGMKGHAVSPETRAKIGAKHKGNSHALGSVRSAETRAKMSAAQKVRFSDLREMGIIPKPSVGRIVSVAVRAQISEKLRGTKRAPEAIAKHRATMQRKRDLVALAGSRA